MHIYSILQFIFSSVPPRCEISPDMLRHLGVVSRLVEYVVPVSSDTLALEQIREAQARRNLVLRNEIIAVLGLVNNELANLLSVSILSWV